MKKYAYFFYELSEIGVYRVDTLQHSALAKNYLFLPFETKDRYYPIRRLDDFINSFI
ncbi:MAG: hypothetical protein RLO81_08870 [Fulvivirga sp.]|uniref:hypothetical protein n=1 Tax=Fulvivirga sp. TaxID=1931237 RepID=UPI0032EFB714